MVAWTTLQSAVDEADISSRAVAIAIMMCRKLWLPASGFPTKIQNTTENLPVSETHLFNKKTDESLYISKDSKATLCSLGIYTSALKRECHWQ